MTETIYDKKTCKCELIPILEQELIKLADFIKVKLPECMEEFRLKKIMSCSKANCCVSCDKGTQYKLEEKHVTILKKFMDHDCMSNWDGNARSMEGEGGRLLIIELNDNEACFVLLLVKDDDGTITASASPRQFTKEEKLQKNI